MLILIFLFEAYSDDNKSLDSYSKTKSELEELFVISTAHENPMSISSIGNLSRCKRGK